MRAISRLALLSATALALAGSALAGPALAEDAPKFDPEAVRAHVTFLADDALEGRDAASRGFEVAAQYVASRFIAMGAAPAAAGGSYFQAVPLREARLDGQPSLTIASKAGSARLDTPAKVLIGPGMLEQHQQVSAPLVFAGFGIDRPDLKLDDYRGIDARGKIVVLLTGYPKGLSSELGAHLNAEKAVMAMKRGAVGVITIPTRQDLARRPWDKRVQMSAGEASVGWVGADGQPFSRAPGIRVSASVNPAEAAPLFAGARTTLDAVLAEADRDGGRPRGFALTGTATIARDTAWKPMASKNVIAMVPGSDPALANEYVLMTAHLDHLGIHGKGADTINNGAMDNASGVATMLEVAAALAKSPNRPKRPILFAAVTAEEKGLVGSDYLARNPVTRNGEVVAVVNFDMPILTYPFQDVVAFGAENSTLGPLVADAAKAAGLSLSPDPLPAEGLFTRSDHYRFVQQGVPAVFLMTGFAGPGKEAFEDFLAHHYHTPSDDLKLPMNWQAGARFAEVNWHIVRAIADAPQRPRWYQGNFFGNEFAAKAPKAAKPVAVK